jgi:hypothetical protein
MNLKTVHFARITLFTFAGISTLPSWMFTCIRRLSMSVSLMFTLSDTLAPVE